MAITSFFSLRNIVDRIEIPIIQRDYAQGRLDKTTTRIRGAFLDALLKALEPNAQAQPLDFIYGEIRGGALIPLDGQQRLTTLFLLHWYLAARLGLATDAAEWRGLPTLTYTTRASSKEFCEKLAACRPPFDNPLKDEIDPASRLGDWLKDQSWFRRACERDPTITGMLVTLNDLHGRLRVLTEGDLRIAWDRLTDANSPAIYFDFLPIADIGPVDEQYIRMNARGKPLTEFERFKARFEEMLGHVSTSDRDTFAHRVDGPWTDLLWPLRDSGNGTLDNVIDDEFLRLFRYLSALAVWKFKLQDCKVEPGGLELHTWVEPLYGRMDIHRERRDFLFKALDALHGTFAGQDKSAIEASFAQWFTKDTHQRGILAIFEETNFLAVCVAGFGEPSIEKSQFSLAQTLLFYALLHGWMKDIAPDVQRLRVLRNLLLAPDADLRQGSVGDRYLPSVEYLIDQGLPNEGTPMPAVLEDAFRGRQLPEEVVKLALKSGNAALSACLEQLEDHPLLKGCLFAFDLQTNPPDIQRRVDTFYELFPPGDLLRHGELLTGALLTKGDYSRPMGDRFQFGSATQERRWRDVLTVAGARSDPSTIRVPLAGLLDDVAARAGDIRDRLQGIVVDWLKKQRRFDWRYYLVKYGCMRRGESGRYYSHSGGMSFDLCMLNKDVLRSYYNDPYIVSIVEQSGIAEDEVTYWFGYSNHLQQDARWLRTNGDVNILRPDPAGWVVNPPDPAQQRAFIDVRRRHGMTKRNGEWILEVLQTQDSSGKSWDKVDRVRLGASLLVDLLPLYL